MFVNVTGNASTSEITSSVEVLKNTSSMLKVAEPDIVYKNPNIWVGTISFATPRNIKSGVISFRVENAWIESNNIRSVRMVRWDGSNWT